MKINLDKLRWSELRTLHRETVLVLPGSPSETWERARALLPHAAAPHMRAWARQGRRLSVAELLIPRHRQVIIEEAQILRLNNDLAEFVRDARRRHRLVVFTCRPGQACEDLKRHVEHAKRALPVTVTG